MVLRIGTRKSKMALAQTAEVCAALNAAGADAEPAPWQTRGDLDQVSKLSKHGGKGGAFVDELREALRAREIDGIMHSLKDVPGNEVFPGVVLGGYMRRQACEDALVLRPGLSLSEFENGRFRIGTNSVRRAAFLKRIYPDATIGHFRGAADTRIRKLDAGIGQELDDKTVDAPVDALIMAVAGLERIDAADRVVRTFSPSEMLPSACQGIVAVECRESDWATRALLEKIGDESATRCAVAERSLLWILNGHCNSAIGAYSTITGSEITIDACVLDDRDLIRVHATGEAGKAAEVGRNAGLALIAKGAAGILDAQRI